MVFGLQLSAVMGKLPHCKPNDQGKLDHCPIHKSWIDYNSISDIGCKLKKLMSKIFQKVIFLSTFLLMSQSVKNWYIEKNIWKQPNHHFQILKSKDYFFPWVMYYYCLCLSMCKGFFQFLPSASYHIIPFCQPLCPLSALSKNYKSFITTKRLIILP